VTRFAAVLLALAVLAACQNQTQAVATPSPSPTPRTAPTAAILQSSDVPATLAPCEGSGPIDLYVDVLALKNEQAANRLGTYWTRILAEGAGAGAISVFVSDAAGCAAELGAATNTKALTSAVVEFAEPGQALRTWEDGLFGFTPPAPGQLASGMARGAGTGLGDDSFTYVRPDVRLAAWRRSVYVALVIATNEDAATFAAATAAVDPRLN
jgi:hypothetical protein